MTSLPRLMPTDPRMFTARVARTRRLSRSFQRVTIVGGDIDEFGHAGFDHWFRVFIPQAPGAPFELPGVVGRSWWQGYLALDEAVRPHCANYTVADVRTTDAGVELDIDVVQHWDESGQLAGAVAIWSTTAEPGSPVAILDQGLIYDPGMQGDSTVIVCDETGVPAARGILRRLDPEAQGVAIIEVPTADDVLDLTGPSGVRIDWIVRDEHSVPGAAAVEAVRTLVDLPVDAYAYVVGESDLVKESRRALNRAGIPKARITFSGYWKHKTEPALTR
jgi:NADPH-dependent ferric siderophore reductase